MPNEPKDYIVKGPLSLLKAAKEECQKVPCLIHLGDSNSTDHKALYIWSGVDYWLEHSDVEEDEDGTTLTLPQDWNTLMDILEGLKKPQVPEYVKYGGCGYKIKEAGNGSNFGPYFLAYTVYGSVVRMQQESTYPITEEEFIQGGLQELEEAGFVKGGKVEYSGPYPTQFTIEEVEYRNELKLGSHSQLSHKEVSDKGFGFIAYCNHLRVPIGQCTLLPTLPQTSQGIPYKLEGSNVYIGPTVGGSSTHVGTVKHWLNLGVSSITLPCGTLTREDLQTILGL